MEDAGGDVEEEADQTYKQVLSEVGLDLVSGQAVPSTKIKGKKEVKVEGNELEDFENQLKVLKE